jgi:toxin ParE1/3/4
MAYQLAPEAETDLDNIWYRIATSSGNAEVAEQFNDTLTERFHMLSDFPKAGRVRDDLGEGRRSFPVQEYVIVYRIAEGDDVDIVRVVDGRRDLPGLFGF